MKQIIQNIDLYNYFNAEKEIRRRTIDCILDIIEWELSAMYGQFSDIDKIIDEFESKIKNVK